MGFAIARKFGGCSGTAETFPSEIQHGLVFTVNVECWLLTAPNKPLCDNEMGLRRVLLLCP